MTGCQRTLFVAIAMTAFASTVCGATIVVHQDGSGDFTTIGAAVAAAATNDLIQVGPGTYPESLTITKSIEIESESGSETTILDGEGSHFIMIIDGVYHVGLTGLTFTHAYAPDQGHGAAILAWHGPTVNVEDCVFTGNVAGWDNGAVHARHAGTYVTLAGCRFEDNHAFHNGGACGVQANATMQIYHCEFRNNDSSGIAGACNAYNHGNFIISNCLFVGNSDGTGAIIVESSSAVITNTTFHANMSGSHASVLFYMADTAVFSHNIVTSDVGGAGVEFLSCTGSHTCNIYFGNDVGTVIGELPTPSEIIADPQFCDYTAGNFTLCVTSPAAPDNNYCGLIGAYGVGCDACGPVRTESTTWGSLKAMFH
jgi:hypothetical protein